MNGYSATPRGLAFHIAGHELRHHRVVLERYVPLVERKGWQLAPDPSPHSITRPSGSRRTP